MNLKKISRIAVFMLFAAFLAGGAQAQLKNTPMHSNLPDTAQMKDCMQCHQSYEAVAKKTENMNPNPHSSHRGEPDCTNCHKVNAKPHFECNDCHELNIKMKGAE